jgi:chemotaxis protein histidine kinase CheA
MAGEEVELDKTILESLAIAHPHIRNCCDHGIGLPMSAPRRASGGRAYQGQGLPRGRQINIEVVDDGRGIDPPG